MYQTLNPTTGELVAKFQFHSSAEIEKALAESMQDFTAWKAFSHSERASVLQSVAVQLEQRCLKLAEIISIEMGKPISLAEAEVRKCAAACKYYAENGAQLLQPDERLRANGGRATVRFEPLGPLLAVMPWNFPFWQVFRFAAPTLMAGNTVLLKHAPNTPQCALAIERLFLECGGPSGIFRSLFLSNEQTTDVIADFRVRGVTLTGSPRAGRAVAEAAGRNLKTVVLELGGSDPFVVLEDADLQEAARVGAISRCTNSGQVCCAAKRFIVKRSIAKDFSEALVAELERQTLGDPLNGKTTMGPLAKEELRSVLAEQVEKSIHLGAKVVFRSSSMATSEWPKGFFYGPELLTDVPPHSPALTEELFGPVAVFIPVDTDEAAIHMANSSQYGLSASVWSKDAGKAEHFAAQLEVGTVVLNGSATSDIGLPFGGTKLSGYGRELGSEGIRAFVNVKSIWAGQS